ncbi:hypothetical protein HYU11_06380 [Candidatus Woesearchaeota archaeon]|nr:hypothetical protein [Candidatus Woesearchaeota archaeon]
MNAARNLSLFASKVAVASTIHEPKGSLMQAFTERAIPLVKEVGLEWYVSATESTDKSLYSMLRSELTACLQTEFFPSNTPLIEENHYSALLLALNCTTKQYIMYIDSDRLSMALSYYPEETARTLLRGLELLEHLQAPILVMNRSADATNTHHLPLVLTEGIISYFYTKAITGGRTRVDALSTAYIVNSMVIRNLLEGYCGGFLAGTRCDFPQGKLLIMSMEYGNPAFICANNMLRYEEPEQFRGLGLLVPNVHEWTSAAYEELTYLSSAIKADLFQRREEWQLRYRTAYQWLDVLKRLHGTPDHDLDRLMKELSRLSRSSNVQIQQARACELFERYNPSFMGNYETCLGSSGIRIHSSK